MTVEKLKINCKAQK